MATRAAPSVADPVGFEDLVRLAEHRGPALTIYLPTARFGPETLQAPVRLRNILRSSADRIEAAFGSETAELLGPLQALSADDELWQHQAETLAILARPGSLETFRLPVELPETCEADERFRLGPLAVHAAGDEPFFVLALAQNDVRLFRATRQSISQLDTGDMPRSMEEALAYEDHEPQFQSRPVGGGDARFHGHGSGSEIDKQAIERFFRAVDGGVTELLGPTRTPVVLACVDYYVPIYRQVTALANVYAVAVAGNPELRPMEELHTAAVEVLEPLRRQHSDKAVARFSDLRGTGMAVTDLDEIATHAREGRVDTLILASDDVASLGADGRAASHALADALTTGAAVATAESEAIGGRSMVAALRY